MNKEKVQEMFNLQMRLNNETNGPHWMLGTTNKGREINWKLCIMMEAAEFCDSWNWKHWKNIDSEHNIDNAKIELVDIWHFLMSEVLRYYKGKIDSDIIEEFSDNFSEVDDTCQVCKDKPVDMKQAISTASVMIDGAINGDIGKVAVGFLSSMEAVRLTSDELYRLYIGKNALNKFRQDNGYKEGTYIKVWNGQEDNVVMQSILEEQPSTTFNELLDKLASVYTTIKS